nr:galactose-1-phosphate uridylyltransferase [Candidatus Pantoea persica]
MLVDYAAARELNDGSRTVVETEHWLLHAHFLSAADALGHGA